MTRDEMMRRMSGREFAAWSALYNVKAEERQREKDEADSGDGIVHVHGLEVDEDAEPEPDPDDETQPIDWLEDDGGDT